MMSWVWIVVPVVARAWNAEARQPAARVRVSAIAARTSQAPFAANGPKGRWANGPQVGVDLFDGRVPSVVLLGLHERQRAGNERRVRAADAYKNSNCRIGGGAKVVLEPEQANVERPRCGAVIVQARPTRR